MKRLLPFMMVLATSSVVANTSAEQHNLFQLDDVFQLEYASQPAVHPDGSYTVFVRNYMDIMSDRRLGNLWRVDHQGDMLPLTCGVANDHSPTLSPEIGRETGRSNH